VLLYYILVLPFVHADEVIRLNVSPELRTHRGIKIYSGAFEHVVFDNVMCTAIIIITLRRKLYGCTHIIINLLTSLQTRMYVGSAVTGRAVGRGGMARGEAGNLIILLLGIR